MRSACCRHQMFLSLSEEFDVGVTRLVFPRNVNPLVNRRWPTQPLQTSQLNPKVPALTIGACWRLRGVLDSYRKVFGKSISR